MDGVQKICMALLLAALMVVTVGCGSSVGFSEAPSTAAAQEQATDKDPLGTTPDPTSGKKTHTDTFIIQGEITAPLDLVWIIDNSGSMEDEVRNVENNLRRFIEQVKSKTDLRMAVISAQSGTEGVRVPAVAGINVRVIDRQVESNDALTILALSFCSDAEVAKGTSAFSAIPLYLRVENFSYSQFCAVSKLQSQLYPEYSNQLVHQGLGDNRFYRPEAAKAFIIVTDDNSNPDAWVYVRGINTSWPDVAWDVWTNGLTANRFHSHVKARFGAQRVKTFSFIDPVGQMARPTKNCGYIKGTEYIRLASLTGGETFDICETNWSAHFDRLTQSVLTHAQRQFALSKYPNLTDATIKSVLIDGRTVASSNYSYESGHLTVSAALIEAAVGKTLTVTYEGNW